MSTPCLMSEPDVPIPAIARGMAVLILDDERFDRHRLARLCSGLGFPCRITNARTLTEFGEALGKDDYGLILLDYALPDGTGFEAAQMVQVCARNLNAPMMMVSGQGAGPEADAMAQRAASLGCTGYLSKNDLSKEVFSRAVVTALGPARPDLPPAKDRFRREEVEALMALCSSGCARDVKPMVSRLMRQLRNLRARADGCDPLALVSIERDCLNLWANLIEMERADGATLMTTLAADMTAADAGKIRSRPPSPFSTRRH